MRFLTTAAMALVLTGAAAAAQADEPQKNPTGQPHGQSGGGQAHGQGGGGQPHGQAGGPPRGPAPGGGPPHVQAPSGGQHNFAGPPGGQPGAGQPHWQAQGQGQAHGAAHFNGPTGPGAQGQVQAGHGPAGQGPAGQAHNWQGQGGAPHFNGQGPQGQAQAGPGGQPGGPRGQGQPNWQGRGPGQPTGQGQRWNGQGGQASQGQRGGGFGFQNHAPRTRDAGRGWYSSNTFARQYQAQRRYRFGGYRSFPSGWSYRSWSYGDFLPWGWFAPDYYVSWADYGLPPPPIGCEWIAQGPDAVLVDIWTGEVLSVVNGVFYWNGY